MTFKQVERMELVNRNIAVCDQCNREIPRHFFDALTLTIPPAVEDNGIKPEQQKHFCNIQCLALWAKDESIDSPDPDTRRPRHEVR